MASQLLQVRHARLLDVEGAAVQSAEWRIVPARLELAGSGFSPAYPLKESKPPLPACLRICLHEDLDVAWVRARVPRLFGITPLPSDGEKNHLWVSFAAIRPGDREAIAFECGDYYGTTSLYFSELETDESAKASVACAFWSALLADPDDLADFEGRLYHIGAGVWLHFGCRNGDFHFRESKD